MRYGSRLICCPVCGTPYTREELEDKDHCNPVVPVSEVDT